ncbi:putative spermidine/putrescine transport system substrate-binding protein|uniref:Putative spermidine/putrescine transport system substrate-binding protein n=1 Tax=Brenneria salicis ATCC 15712 = DSM 30166 TaxID=714314 RepID=A0A366I1D3_9GAMM|nr:ABC transporter substrate-binding protein [Brenneria salicis]NMN92103.1 putative spermidine/putrescine transport system substrate-binding protein [Brenneria salicis ATCC 15712 = DSM 30166]RBP61146.1 putative spermidine/putrescine transport system substrate-binding protein [Brenneria salicis ATCC 15712 = DSM 30166]RLM30171.1 ABC transporter substrate-binding protein [Brenneria salicis ATCC 15712 = DSM 30166]
MRNKRKILLSTCQDERIESINASRRRLIKQGSIISAGMALSSFSVPAVFAKSKQEVIVRGLGGTYQEAMENAVYNPFTAETGINVKIQPSTAAQILAMVKSGQVSIDVLDLGDIIQINLDKAGALVPINYSGMKFCNPDDILPELRHPNMIGNLLFATVMVYNTDVFKTGIHPKSWKEFWDVQRFPGPRTLADMRSGSVELEFALLADNVEKANIYPINIERALASLDKIKPQVSKWWDTGAVSAQLLERKDAVLGAIWNGRAQALIDQGAPLAIEWNQAKQQVQYWSVVKGAPNPENAQLLIDFALQPQIQAKLTQFISYGPTNKKAFDFVRPEDLAKLPSNPAYFSHSFVQDAVWWSDNLDRVGKVWQQWFLGQA